MAAFGKWHPAQCFLSSSCCQCRLVGSFLVLREETDRSRGIGDLHKAALPLEKCCCIQQYGASCLAQAFATVMYKTSILSVSEAWNFRAELKAAASRPQFDCSSVQRCSLLASVHPSIHPHDLMRDNSKPMSQGIFHNACRSRGHAGCV